MHGSLTTYCRQARQQLNTDELVHLIYDGAPAHRNAVNPAANTELARVAGGLVCFFVKYYSRERDTATGKLNRGQTRKRGARGEGKKGEVGLLV